MEQHLAEMSVRTESLDGAGSPFWRLPWQSLTSQEGLNQQFWRLSIHNHQTPLLRKGPVFHLPASGSPRHFLACICRTPILVLIFTERSCSSRERLIISLYEASPLYGYFILTNHICREPFFFFFQYRVTFWGADQSPEISAHLLGGYNWTRNWLTQLVYSW